MLVTDATFQIMTDTVATDADEWGYEASGLGVKRWRTALGPTWGHTGEDTGYKAYWHYAPDHDLTWVLLLNANYGQLLRVRTNCAARYSSCWPKRTRNAAAAGVRCVRGNPLCALGLFRLLARAAGVKRRCRGE